MEQIDLGHLQGRKEQDTLEPLLCIKTNLVAPGRVLGEAMFKGCQKDE